MAQVRRADNEREKWLIPYSHDINALYRWEMTYPTQKKQVECQENVAWSELLMPNHIFCSPEPGNEQQQPITTMSK